MLGGSLQSVAALLVCMAASPEDERVGIFALQPSEFPGATGEGWGFRYISTPAVDLLACIPAGREEERDKLVTFLCFRHLSFPERGVGGGVFCGFLQSAAALLVCMPAGREGKRAGRF